MKNIAILIFSCLAFAGLAQAREYKLQMQDSDLAFKRKILAPEGITIAPSGLIYTASMLTGKIYVADGSSREPQVAIDLGQLQEWKLALHVDQVSVSPLTNPKPKALGILAESETQLWVALPNVLGGCVYSIKKLSNRYSAQAAFCQAGDVNGLVIDPNRDRLYISSRNPGLTYDGKVMSVSLSSLKASVNKSTIIKFDGNKHLMLESEMPNGLSLSSSGKYLMFVETIKNRVRALNLKTRKIHTVFSSGDDGWMDGLTYLKDENIYVSTDSKLGKLYFFDFAGKKKVSYEITNLEGQPTGLASVDSQGNELFVTDMWLGNTLDKALEEISGLYGYVKYHNRVYKLSLNRLLK